jgi:hypothetical protein
MLSTIVRVDAMSTPISHANGDSHVGISKNILEGPKPYHNLGLKKSKPYP